MSSLFHGQMKVLQRSEYYMLIFVAFSGARRNGKFFAKVLFFERELKKEFWSCQSLSQQQTENSVSHGGKNVQVFMSIYVWLVYLIPYHYLPFLVHLCCI